MEVQGKIIVITGASRGIGAATARELAQKGGEVVLIARTEKDLLTVSNEIKAKGGKSHYYAADLSDTAKIESLCQQILQELGRVDILINNAGLGRWLWTDETPLPEAETMIKLPYLAAFSLSSCLLPQMIERGNGAIININSPVCYFTWPGATAYASSRWALRGFTESLRGGLRGTGVKVMHFVFGKTNSNYFVDNPGAEERLPSVSSWIPDRSPEQVARYIYSGIKRNKKTMFKPLMLAFFIGCQRISPWLIRQILWKTGARRDKH